MAGPAPPVAEVSVAAPAVAQAIVAGVMAGVSCGHKETPCNTGTVTNMTHLEKTHLGKAANLEFSCVVE